MNQMQNKLEQKNGILFIILGIVITWFFNDTVGFLIDIVGALLIYIGMDKLRKDHPAFEKGRLAALLMFGARVCILICDFVFEPNSALAVMFSCIFMVPDVLGMVLALVVLSEGLSAIQKEYGVELNAVKFAKNVKAYSISAVTILMSTIFASFGAALFSFVLVIAFIAAIIFLLMLLYKLGRILNAYDDWRASRMVSASWSVTDETETNQGSEGGSGVFMPMPETAQPEEKHKEESTVKTIYLAGGCFWGAEKYLGLVPGVVDTNVGYANGTTENPSYEDVKYRHTGHAETVRVKYDETKISLEKLLEKYFEVIDPVSVNKQGEDEGIQYRTGIYYTDKADLPTINKVYEKVAEEHEEPLAVEVLPLVQYFEAEEYHQKYLDKNPQGYCHIDGCMFEKAKQL